MKTVTTRLGLMVLSLCGPFWAQSRFAEGLQYPQRLIFTPQGNLLASEGGTPVPNTGRVSIVNRQGTRRSLLEGLPAAPGHNIPAFGPVGLALDGRTLYVLLGDGDIEVGPPFVLNTQGTSSPMFDSVLRFDFSVGIDTIQSGFQLTSVDHWALSDGYDLELRNASGDRATVRALVAFRPLWRNLLGGPARYRPSNPFGVWLDGTRDSLYVADASAETIVKVDTVTGRSRVLTRFQPQERTTPAGPSFVDNVPTGVCPAGESLLVSFLSSSPFPAGESSVKLWRPSDGTWSRPTPLVTGLTMTTDLVCLRGGSESAPRVVTVEYSTTTDRTVPSGRVQLIDGSQKKVLVENVLLPTAAAQDPVSGDLFVATLAGLILRVPLP